MSNTITYCIVLEWNEISATVHHCPDPFLSTIFSILLHLNSFLVFSTAFVQGVRGLLMCGLTLGFFGVVLCFIGMECTYIGGAEKPKDKMVLAGSVFHFCGGEYSTVQDVLVSVNTFCPHYFSVSTKPCVRRCVQYFWLLLIHQQGCQNSFCSQCWARSLKVCSVSLIYLIFWSMTKQYQHCFHSL